MKFSFIITTYKEKLQCLNQIELIRSYKHLNKSNIIIVSTAEDSGIFNQFKNWESIGVHFIALEDAPGNPKSTFKLKNNGEISYPDNFRAKYIAPRVLFSMEMGIRKAIELNSNYALHCHSDGFYPTKQENRIIEDIEKLGNKTAMVDLNDHEELPPKRGVYAVEGTHFLPECQLYNLDKISKIGYQYLSCVHTNAMPEFICHNYISCEACLGQFAHFSLTGKNANNPRTRGEDIFYNEFLVRSIRSHHGVFDTGFVNLPGIQE